jgi:outer membrane protein TolC
LLSLDEQLKTTQKTIELRKEQLQTLKALKQAGLVNEVSIQQSSSQLYTVLGIKQGIEKQIFVQENALSVLLGQSPGSIQRGSLSEFTMNTDANTGIPVQLLANRPDVKAAEYALMQAFEMTNVAQTQFYPAFRIGLSGGYNAQKLSDWFDPSSAFFNMLSSLTQPVFNQRRLKTDLEIARINQEQALIQFEESVLQAGKEVSDAVFEIENTNRQYEIKTQKLKADINALKVSEQLLNQGLINYLDVLIAQESKLNTELELINLSSQKWSSRIQLYRALGGGAM